MTSMDGEREADWTVMTEPDRRARERVRVEGGDVKREGPARGEASRGSTLCERLALFRARVALVWVRTRTDRRVLISAFKSLFNPSNMTIEAHSLPMSSLVS